MALHWDLTDINNHKEMCWIPEGNDEFSLNPVTDALIWLTMIVDFTPRKKKDAEEFFLRVRQWESTFGSILKQREKYWAVVQSGTFEIFYIEEHAKSYAKDNGGKILEGERHVDRLITWEEVYLHIGLSTNVHSESKAKFKNKVAAKLRGIAERSLSSEEKDWAEKQKTNIERLAEAVEDAGVC